MQRAGSISAWAKPIARLAGSAIALGAASACALAQDIQFGPSGDGPGAARAGGGYDREFIKEWQSNPPKGFPTLSKANVAQTKLAVDRYTQIVEAGGFVAIPEMQLEPGQTHDAVNLLRQRLTASGELRDETSYANYFGSELEKAVMRFQASNGLAPTGIVDKRTIAALNVPADVRLKQLKVNLERLADLVKIVGKRYVLVNIPAAQVEAIENNTVISRHSGVVGKPDRPTPQIRSTITDLNFNPVWTLPPTVIKEDLIPKGQDMQEKGQNVLEKFGIDAYQGGKKISSESIDWKSSKPMQLSYRQAPGKENPLGFLKINFPSASSVYMHDSPERVAVRPQLPRRQLRVCAGAEHRGACRLAARGPTGMDEGAGRGHERERPDQDDPIEEARYPVFCLRYRLGDRGRRDTIPARRVPEGRRRRDRCGILGGSSPH